MPKKNGFDLIHLHSVQVTPFGQVSEICQKGDTNGLTMPQEYTTMSKVNCPHISNILLLYANKLQLEAMVESNSTFAQGMDSLMLPLCYIIKVNIIFVTPSSLCDSYSLHMKIHIKCMIHV